MRGNQALHVLNGEYMYNYFKKIHFLEGELMVPFNEAMCYGPVCEEIFSQPFIQIRANVHQVPVEKYKEMTIKRISPLIGKNFSHLTLWFDEDMFCQINLLTILAWLDKNNYQENVKINIVDDQFELKESVWAAPEGYYSIYKQVLIEKRDPGEVYPEFLQKGIALYLHFSQEENEIIRYIKKHLRLSDEELAAELIVNFSQYGLGDVQYLDMIKNCRRREN